MATERFDGSTELMRICITTREESITYNRNLSLVYLQNSIACIAFLSLFSFIYISCYTLNSNTSFRTFFASTVDTLFCFRFAQSDSSCFSIFGTRSPRSSVIRCRETICSLSQKRPRGQVKRNDDFSRSTPRPS